MRLRYKSKGMPEVPTDFREVAEAVVGAGPAPSGNPAP